ncbi:MAG: LysM peptidoglycan-binding domain-containing protein [Firmicutes bacterium]|nr:LysM peptidoglycan-binding domain-containing protein [Bacillota bacterium]
MKGKIGEILSSATVFGLLIVLPLTFLIVGVRFLDKKTTSNHLWPTQIIHITVEPGDTLWNIAKNKVPEKDPRDVVGNIKARNQLVSGQIFPGQVLEIEVWEAARQTQLAERSKRL